MNETTKTFGEVIYAYTDQQAVADGVLKDITNLDIFFQGMRLNRMADGLWYDFAKTIPGQSRAEDVNLDALRRILKAKLNLAYFKGDIWQVPPGLWLIENEVNGWTIMRPQDY